MYPLSRGRSWRLLSFRLKHIHLQKLGCCNWNLVSTIYLVPLDPILYKLDIWRNIYFVYDVVTIVYAFLTVWRSLYLSPLLNRWVRMVHCVIALKANQSTESSKFLLYELHRVGYISCISYPLRSLIRCSLILVTPLVLVEY